MNPEKVNQLYNFLADNGVEDIGTDMGFMARMQNIEDRKKLYDFLSTNKVEGIGTTFAEFDEILGIEPAPKAKIPSWEDFKEATQRESVEGRLAAARDALKRTTTQDFVAEQMDMPLTDIVQQERDYVIHPSEKVFENIDKGNVGQEEYKYLDGQRRMAVARLDDMIDEAEKLYQEERAQYSPMGNLEMGTSAKFYPILSSLKSLRKKYDRMVSKADKEQGEDGGFAKGFADNFDLLNTLSSGWMDVAKGIDQLAVRNKAARGEKLTPEEQLYMRMFDEQSRLESIIEAEGGATRGYNIGSGLAENIPFITSMLSTSGVASAVKGGVNKGLGAVGREAAKEGAEKSFKNFAARAVDGLVGSATAAAVTTPLQAGMYNNYIDNALDEYATHGQLVDSPLQRLWKSGADAFTDTFTEHLGGVFTGAAKYALKGVGAKTVLGKLYGTVERRIQPFYRDILKRTAQNGVAGEIEEEMWANILSPLMRGDSKEERRAAWKEAFSKESVITTIATTAIMSAGFGVGKVASAADATIKYEKFKNKAKNSLALIEDKRLEQKLVDIMALPTLQERCQAFANIDWQGDYKSMGHAADYFYNSIVKEVYDGAVKMEDANEVVMPTLRVLNTVIERGSTDIVTAQMDGNPVYIIKGIEGDAESVIVQDMDGNRSQVAISSLQELNSTPVSEVVADLINKEYNAISAEMDANEQAEDDASPREQGLVPPSEKARADQFTPEEEVMYNGQPAVVLSIDRNDGTARINIEGGEENKRVNISDLQKMEMAPEVATPKVEAVLNEAGEVDVVSTGEEQTANYLAQEFETPEDAIGYADDKIAAAQKALKKAQSNDKLPLNITERKKVIAERKAEIARIESEIAMWEGVKARLTQPQQTEQAPAEVAPEVESAPVAEQATTEEVAEVTAPQAEVEQEEDAEVTTNEQVTEKAPAEEDIHTREQVEALEWKAGVVMNAEARDHKATEALDKMAKEAGVRVAFVDDVVENGIEGNGLYDPKTKTIYIAGNRLQSFYFVAGHEMLHHIKTLSPEAYDQYVNAVKAEMGKDFEKQKEYIRKNYRTSIILAMSRRGELSMSADEMEAQIERQMPSDEVLTEEVVADWTGALIGYSDGFSRFVKKHEGSAMLRVFRNALEHLRTFFTGKNSFERTMQRRLKALDTLLDESMGKTPSKAERKSLLSLRESANSLVGVHNISLAKLNKAVKMGGLANPSVAVLDINKNTHEDYGEISLILPSTMVDSRLGRNAGTWAGDAWTPTYPQVVKRIDKDEDISRFYKDINKMPDRMRNKVALDWNSYLEDRSAPALAYWFLFEKGNAPEMLTIPSKYPEEIVEQVRNATNGAFSLYQLSPKERMAVVEAFIAQEYNGDQAAYEKALQDKIERIESRGLSHKSALVRKSAEQDLASIKEYGFDYDQISNFVRDVEQDFNHRGEEDIEGTIRNAQEYIKENGLQEDFDAWKVELDNRYNVGEYIFNGYTNSGDRKWLPHTIENASKWMKKQGREGSVAIFPSFGVFVAVAIPHMTSLASIRKRKSQLGKTEQEFNEFKDKWEPIYYELGQKLQPDAKGYEDYGWWRLIEAVGQKNPQEFFKTQYGIELSDEDMQKFNEMVNAIRTDYPAKYFETKFERPVQLSEFTAAVVPNTTPQEVENTLREAGVAVYEYDKNTEGSRKKVMLEATDSEGVRFALRLSPEEQEIVEKAKADGTYLKAPNGKPTNLTPKQWAQVRTKAFKKWFGDWEKVARIEKLRNSPSIIATGEEYIGNYELSNKSAAEYINNELRGSYTNKDTNESIKITRKGAFKVTRHDAENEVHLKSIALIPEMLENAIFITEESNDKRINDFESYRYYVVGVNMAGVEYTAKLVIGVKNGETYYDHSLTEIEKTNLIDRRDEISSSFTANEDAIFEYKDKRLISILQINSSKVVDANGEPKVVYHGTPNIFTAFDKKMRGVSTDRGIWGNGFYFSESSDYADTYAKRKNSEGRTMELFLNVKKPLFISLKNGGNEGAMYFNTLQTKYFTDEVYDDINKVEENMVRAQENLSSEIESSGYDGVIVEYSHSTLADEYIAFEPTQIKSATENVGTFDANNPDVRFSLRTPDTFYSNAEFAVRGIKQEKATPEQWLKMIEKNGGLKAGEDKWLGLSDWLKESKAKTLTKQEVLDYINSNKIVVEEVEYGVQDYMSENEIYESDEYRALEESLLEYEDETPYIDKEKFKELRNKDEDFIDGFDVDYWGEQLLVKNPFAAARYLGISNVGKRINETRLQYTTNGLTNKREIALVVPTIEPWKADDDIHFGDAGEGRAVAWVRFGDAEAPVRDANYIRLQEINDRLAELEFKVGSSEGITMEEYEERARLREERDGIPESGNERILVIDEIQSKRHQEGREKGYRTSDIDKYLKDNNVEVKETGEFYEFYKDGELDKRFSRGLLHYNINEAKKLYVGGYQKSDIPEAPFEKNWHEVAMKRILRYAAENGYDKVAWTTGDQQAERYDISKTVDNIKSEDNNIEELSDGTPIVKNITIYAGDSVYNLYVDKNGVAHGRQFGDQPLADIVGKPLAEKLMEKGDFELEGDGLRIGGEGMKGFYDQILPNFMNKYGKKWGVKVGEVTMPDLAENNTMHSVDITPAMRESIMQGQPLFSLRLPGYKERFKALSEEYNALDKNDAQAVADFRARKRTLVEEYWNDFASALGADVEVMVVDSTNNPEVLRPVYEAAKESLVNTNPNIKIPTFEEFVEYWEDENEVASHFADTRYIVIDIKKADGYNTQKSFTQHLIHEYIHDIIDRNVNRHQLLRVWQESATTDYGKALRKGYKEETSAQLGSEVLAYLISGRANTNITPLLNYIEGDDNVSVEDVLTTFGNSLPLRDYIATNILSILRNGYKGREVNQEGNEQNQVGLGESRVLRGGAAREASRAQRTQATQREVVEEDGITLEEVDLPEFDEQPKYSIREISDEELLNRLNHTMSWMTKAEELLRKTFQDNMVEIGKLQEVLKKNGVKIFDDNDYYAAENATSSRADVALDKYTKEYITPLQEFLGELAQKYDLSYEDVTDYLLAKHSIERHESGLNALNPNPEHIWGRANVENIVKTFEGKVKEGDVKELWKRINAVNNRNLEILVEGGVKSRADIEAIKSHNWQYYVPLMDWDEEANGLTDPSEQFDVMVAYRNGATNGKWFQPNAKGRTTKPSEPLANMFIMGSRAIIAAETNKAKIKLYNLLHDANKTLGSKVGDAWHFSKRYYVKDASGIWSERKASDLSAEDIAIAEAQQREIKALERERRKAYINANKLEAKGQVEDARIERQRGDALGDEIKDKKAQMDIRVERPNEVFPHEIKMPQAFDKQREVLVYINGRAHIIEFKNVRFANAINGVTNIQLRSTNKFLNTAFKVYKGFTRVKSQLSTSFNPAFALLTNPIRDFLHACIIHSMDAHNGHFLGFIKNFFSHWGDVWRSLRDKSQPLTTKEMEGKNIHNRHDRNVLITEFGRKRVNDTLYQIFQENGGQTGFAYVKDIDEVRRNIRKRVKRVKKGKNIEGGTLSQIFRFYENLSQMAEVKTRYATFLAAIDAGESVGKAIDSARNITVNFGRRGDLTSVMGGLYIFFNAYVQATAQIVKTAWNNKARSAAILTALGVLGYLWTSALDDLWGDEEDGDEISQTKMSDWLKQGYFAIPLNQRKGAAIRIPMPQGLRVPFAIGSIISDYNRGYLDDKETANAIWNVIATDFVYGFNEGARWQRAFAPSVVQTSADIKANEDVWGRRIYKEDIYGASHPNTELGNNNVSPIIKGITDWLNKTTGGNEFKSGKIDFNPSKVQYRLEQAFGGLGSFVRRTGEFASSIAPNNNVEFELQNIPILGNLLYSVKPQNWLEGYAEIEDKYGSAAFASAKKQHRAGYMSEEEWRGIAVPAARFKALDSRIKNLIKLRNEYVPSSAEYKVINREINRQRGLVVKIFEEADINNPQSISDIVEKYDPNRRENLTNLYKEYAK